MRLVKVLIDRENFGSLRVLMLIVCVCRRTQFMYGSIFDDMNNIVGVAKFDLSREPELGSNELKAGGNIAGLFLHGSARFGGEAIFVPKRPGTEAPEDDGYLICFVHDENTGYVFYLITFPRF